jgi:hypothetical protein
LRGRKIREREKGMEKHESKEVRGGTYKVNVDGKKT